MDRLQAAIAAAQALAAERLALAIGPGASPVGQAMRYATEGGKGLRGFLVIEGARLHGVAPEIAAGPAAAIEALHAYSLIHDDLPAMDDDDLRRGRPTVHRAWDEATAILAGDALQALAFELIAGTPLPARNLLALTAGLARAAGLRGMVGGQEADIAAETAAALTLDQITALQAQKTGALILWSATAGPVMAGSGAQPLEEYGRAVGLAFQIADDVLDVEGDAAAVGKALRKDAAAGKATFVSLLGLDGAKRRAADLVDQACAALAPYGEEGHLLRDLAHYTVARKS